MSDKDEKNEDVLKKLRDVRRKLQDSLNDDSSNKPKEESLSKKIEKVEKDEKADTAAKETSKPKLYKAGEDATEKKQISPKKLKKAKAPTTTGISARKMAGVQKRIQKRVASRQSMSKKRRAMMIVALLIGTIPLFFIQTIALATVEFDFTGFNLQYYENTLNPNSSALYVSIPVSNPSILPASIGYIQFELQNTAGTKVGIVKTYAGLSIDPRASSTLHLVVKLDPENAGDWLTSLVSTLVIDLSLANFVYNGISLPLNIALPVIDLKDTIVGLLSGLDISGQVNNLIGGMGAAQGLNTQMFEESTEEREVINPWLDAKEEALAEGRNMWEVPESAQDDLMAGMAIDISETDEKFALNLSMSTDLIPAIGPFDLGTITLSNLDIGIYVDDSDQFGQNIVTNYDKKIINVTSFAPPDNPDDPDLTIAMGGDSAINILLEIMKDDIGSDTIHPSYNSTFVNWTSPANVTSFLSYAQRNLPLYYFLYNFLGNGKVNMLLGIDNLDVEIFGIQLNNLSIPHELLGAFALEGLDIGEITGANPSSSNPSAMGIGVFG
ncbi:MAG: hypothetical protein GY870_00890, partial [archaeon]|nr:hypothetical protein [archaeon]